MHNSKIFDRKIKKVYEIILYLYNKMLFEIMIESVRNPQTLNCPTLKTQHKLSLTKKVDRRSLFKRLWRCLSHFQRGSLSNMY